MKADRLLVVALCLSLWSLSGCTFEDSTYDLGPSWSPDGNTIAFASRDSTEYHIYVVDPGGRGRRRITSSEFSETQPVFSPDGTKIAFVVGKSRAPMNPTASIYVTNSDGGDRVRLTTGEEDNFPRWSPDGSKILFLRGTFGSKSITVMNRDGSDQRTLLQSNAEWSFADPAWSPDGKTIAFTSNSMGITNGVFLINIDGSGPVRLSDGSEPSWSPDGSKLAFSSARDEDFEIYVMNADGSDQKRLTRRKGWDQNPAWSPDGKRIAFVSLYSDGAAISVINSDGSDLSLITAPNQVRHLGNILLLLVLAGGVAFSFILAGRLRINGGKAMGLSLSALLCGIVGAFGTPLIGWGFATPIADVAAIVFGALGVRASKGNVSSASEKRMGIAGIVLGAIGILALLIITVVVVLRSFKYVGLAY